MKCPKCKGDTFKVEYTPQEGFDPSLKKYQCQDCHVDFYVARQAHFTVDTAGIKRPLA
jgi:transposase-like protein